MKSGIMKKALLFLILYSGSNACHAQSIGGTINTYTAVTVPGVCPNKLTVADATGFAAGNTVIIIQMQGAVIDETNSAAFGTITSYNSAGLWEKAIIASVSGNIITLTKNLLNTYSISGKVQMIRVPSYTNATITSTLTGNAWNGSSGGVIALEVSNTLLFNSDIDASGIGFRGAPGTQVCPNSCGAFTNENAYYYAIGNYRGAYKGEGIAEAITNKELGRGAQANGGGGGNDHNNGGGGGGNYAAGGLGGNNADPGAFTCKGNNNHGRPGNSLNYTSLTKLFLGGSGGAGHGNNGPTGGCGGSIPTSTGGSGGGLVIIIAGTIDGNGHSIFAKGAAGQLGAGDGGGGGGSGGTIFLSSSSYTNNLTLDLRGGVGGNGDNFGTNRCIGPGGGGGAGIVISTTALPVNVTSLLTGGAPGIVTSSLNACNGTSTTATSGGNSATPLTGAVVPQSFAGPNAGCGLPVTFIHFNGKGMEKKIVLKWATATEVDASHFSIERSTDNILFREIGSVPAAGNTSWRTDYLFDDLLPYPGKNYYRLRQVDITGYEKLTSVILIDLDVNALVKNFYPNPVHTGTVLQVEFRDPEKKHSLKLLDISGRVIREWIKPGNNLIAESIRMPEHSPGVYLLEISTGVRKQVVKVVVK